MAADPLADGHLRVDVGESDPGLGGSDLGGVHGCTLHSSGDGATLDEVHITIEQFEDEARYEPDGTVVIDLLGIRHRCPDGTPCADATRHYAKERA